MIKNDWNITFKEELFSSKFNGRCTDWIWRCRIIESLPAFISSEFHLSPHFLTFSIGFGKTHSMDTFCQLPRWIIYKSNTPLLSKSNYQLRINTSTVYQFNELCAPLFDESDLWMIDDTNRVRAMIPLHVQPFINQ